MTWVLVVVIFSLLVLVHELGHFWAARRSGVNVEEFGLGFPPRVYSRLRGGTRYSLNWLPLGGFVKLQGEDGADSRPGSFAAASLAAKTRILLAGVAMNLALAYVLLTALAVVGMPPVLANQFKFGQPTYAEPPHVLAAGIQAGSPAAAAGIKAGETIFGSGQLGFRQAQDLLDFSRERAGQTVQLEVGKGSQRRSVEVRLREPGSKNGYLGVVPFETYKLRYGWAAPVVAAGILLQLVWGTLAAFGGLVTGLLSRGQVSDQVTGPVGIAALLGNVSQLGLSYLLVLVAAISVSLAVLNVLPLPALDGGRLSLLWVQRWTKRPLTPKVEAAIHAAGFIALIALMILVTYFDVRRLR